MQSINSWLISLNWTTRTLVMITAAAVMAVIIAPVVFQLLGGHLDWRLAVTAIISASIIAPPLVHALILIEKISETNRIKAENAKCAVERRNAVFQALLENSAAIHQADSLASLLDNFIVRLQTLVPSKGLLILISGGVRHKMIRCMTDWNIPEKEKQYILENHHLLLQAEEDGVMTNLRTMAESEASWSLFKVNGRENAALGCLLIKGPPILPEDAEVIQLFIDQLAMATENKLLIIELEKLANHDQLTGVYNRNYFELELSRQIALKQQNPGTDFSIILVDLNGLKKVNDTYGHPAGDTLIIAAATILKEKCRIEDVVTRLGGDEFAILCPCTSLDQAQAIRQRLVSASAVATVARFDDDIPPPGETPVSFSVGLASSSESSPEAVLNEADKRMYEEKSRHYHQQALAALQYRR